MLANVSVVSGVLVVAFLCSLATCEQLTTRDFTTTLDLQNRPQLEIATGEKWRIVNTTLLTDVRSDGRGISLGLKLQVESALSLHSTLVLVPCSSLLSLLKNYTYATYPNIQVPTISKVTLPMLEHKLNILGFVKQVNSYPNISIGLWTYATSTGGSVSIQNTTFACNSTCWAQQHDFTLTVSNPTQFMEALEQVAAYPAECPGHAHIKLARSISLQPLLPTWPVGGINITANLTIMGEPGQGVVLDLGAAANLIRMPMAYTITRLEWLTVVNLPVLPPFFMTFPMYTFHWSRKLRGVDPATGQVHAYNCTLVFPEDEFNSISLWVPLIEGPTTAVAALANWIRVVIAESKYKLLSQDSLYLFRFQGLNTYMEDITATHIVPPGFPLIRPSNGLKKIMENPLDSYPYIQTVSREEELRQQSVSMQFVNAVLGLLPGVNPATTPVMLAVMSNITLTPAKWTPIANLTRDMTIMGHPWEEVTLDLNHFYPYYSVRNFLGRVTIRDMTLRGLASLQTYSPLLPAEQQGTQRTLALALWAFQCDRTNSRLQLRNLRLEVSRQELQILAMCPFAEGDTPVLRAFCIVNNLDVVEKGEVGQGYVHVKAATGAGWEGTNLTFFTTAATRPRPDLQVLLDTGILNPEGTSPTPPIQAGTPLVPQHVPPSPSSTSRTGLIVGAVVGSVSAALIATALVTWLVMRHSRNQPFTDLAKDDLGPTATDGKRASGGAAAPAQLVVASSAVQVVPTKALADGRKDVVVAKGVEDSNFDNQLDPGSCSPKASTESSSRQLQEVSVLTELQQLALEVGQQISDEQLIVMDVIGSGGYSTVYRGLWQRIPVAVKTTLFHQGSEHKDMALQEAAISKSISHANIVATYSFDVKSVNCLGQGHEQGMKISQSPSSAGQEWRLYIVQEYCDAGSLKDWIRAGRLQDRAAKPIMMLVLELAYQTVSGMLHLHSKNIIHGDLKPENVLLKSSASSPVGAVVKLADFGLSVRITQLQSHVSNWYKGTPFYVSPEVCSGRKMSKASDVFSFGVMLWEMANSKLVWRANATTREFEVQPDFPLFPYTCPWKFAELGRLCLLEDYSQRPSFDQVQRVLWEVQQEVANQVCELGGSFVDAASSSFTARLRPVRQGSSAGASGVSAMILTTAVPVANRAGATSPGAPAAGRPDGQDGST